MFSRVYIYTTHTLSACRYVDTLIVNKPAMDAKQSVISDVITYPVMLCNFRNFRLKKFNKSQVH